jgi:predicted deacylase
MTGTQIFTDIDYDRQGKQVGWLYVPHSVTRSAYGNIAVPIAVLNNGSGATVLFMAGVHGDEYEGQIALSRLVRDMDPSRVQGRVIILPAVNLPAALAGTRVSPLDGGNLNRAFPGDPDGSPTQKIAHYIDQVLFPISNFCHDFHSGGGSLDYLPFVSMRRTEDTDLNERTMRALLACGAEQAVVWTDGPARGFANWAAARRGVICLGGEFGGGGGVSRQGIALVERAMEGLLHHAGVVETELHPHPGTRIWHVGDRSFYVLAPEAGLFEPFTELGETIGAGDLCGQVHFVDNPVRAPEPVVFRAAGTVVAKRRPGRVERGDCVAHLAQEPG